MSKKAAKAAAALASRQSECVRVVVRVRPMSKQEIKDARQVALTSDDTRGEVTLNNCKNDGEEPKVFTFDATYGPNSLQKNIYDITASPIVDSVLDGFNGTIFAYGQTGAGKSFTMEGAPDPPELQGIIPNSFKHIFDQIGTSGDERQFLVRASYLEIYNEDIRDLLSKDPKNRLELRESVDSGVYVQDLTSVVVNSVGEIDQVLQSGKKNRSVGATLMNQESSRSHSIFTVTIESSELAADGERHFRVGKLNMVDLAGSERQSKTGATGDRLKEATKINLSLSALGNVISSLVDSKSSYVPYRDSKLTRLLEDSLGGNTKTVMIANCGPAEYNYDETLSTLRYASRAKKIKNKPKINEDPKDAMLRQFQEEIERLRQQLAQQAAGGGVPMGMGGAADGSGPHAAAAAPVVETVVVEKLVERFIERIPEEKLREMEAKAEMEREALRLQAEEERRALMQRHEISEQERKKLEAELDAKEQANQLALQQQQTLAKKLEAMQQKLIMGGKLLDKAQKQEAELRRAEVQLQREQEQRAMQEAQHQREMEEANLLMEEQYKSLQEEVNAKTAKLKRCWQKLQATKQEVNDLQEEFQREREDMTAAIRDLQRQLRLKELLLANFVPPMEVARMESRAMWNEEVGDWEVRGIEFAGNIVNPRRPIASGGRRPESEYARHRGSASGEARFRADNVANLDMDMPEHTTTVYEGPSKSQRVAAAINAALEGKEEDVTMDAPEMLPDAERIAAASGSSRPKSAVRKKSSTSSSGTSKSKRPGTASRQREAVGSNGSDDEYSAAAAAEDRYPTARGLVSARK